MFEVVVPQGIRIGETVYGKGLFAAKNFSKGVIIYTNKVEIVNNDLAPIQFIAINNDGSRVIHEVSHTHTVKSAADERYLYTFDSFYNHSCDANTFDVPLNDDATEFQMVAARDIKEGDELTCNYLLFDYECDGHTIDQCACGSEKCYGRIHGFKNLPFDTQVSLLPLADPAVKAQFVRDHPSFAVDKQLLVC